MSAVTNPYTWEATEVPACCPVIEAERGYGDLVAIIGVLGSTAVKYADSLSVHRSTFFQPG